MDIASLRATATPQDDSQAIYAAKISSQEAEIDWSRDSAALDCHIRAFAPFPGAWCPRAKRASCGFLRARPVEMERPQNAAVGSVVFVSKNTLHLATGDGALAIEQLQPAGKKPMSVADFLNGQKTDRRPAFNSTGRLTKDYDEADFDHN